MDLLENLVLQVLLGKLVKLDLEARRVIEEGEVPKAIEVKLAIRD